MGRTAEADVSERLPREVHADLVDTLFGTVASFLSGAVGGLLVPVIAWYRTGDPVFAACLVAILVLTAFRIYVLAAYRRTPPEIRRRYAVRWERIYGFGGVSFMTAVGITAAILLAKKHDEMTALYGVVIVLGCAGSLAGRNAGRPRIVLGQMLGVCGPVAATFLLEFDAWYWGVAAIFVLVMVSTKSTTRFLNGVLVSALLSGREARIQRQRLASAMNAMSHGLCMTDRDGIVAVVNARLTEFFDVGEDARGLSFPDFVTRIAASGAMSPTVAGRLVDALSAQIAAREARAATWAIGTRTFLFRSEPMDNGGAVVVVEDVTEATKAAAQVQRLAHFDTLTDLPNRTLFRARLQEALQTVADGSIALFAIDLDRFKEVNDTLGHPMGDRLLRQVADRLRMVVGPHGTVARFGGDEFQVVMPYGEETILETLAETIIAKLSAPYLIDGHVVSVGASIGLAVAPRDACEADELVKRADMALYGAKDASRGTFRRFTMEMDEHAQRKRTIEQELRHALTRGGLEVHYQPIVEAEGGRVIACEALLRWRHPAHGYVSPAQFIPIAEETGLLVEIGEYVLRRACTDAANWPSAIRVAVNVSGRQFMLQHDLHARIREILAATGLAADRLELEITESTLVTAQDALALLAGSGVRLSLDDFGTGYSSLSYLRQFPVDKIKIDRSFVISHADPVSLAIIEAVRSLATALKIDLVAEGVETHQQLDRLKRLGVEQIQGYLFSRPRPLTEIAPLLQGGIVPPSASKAA